MCAQTAQLDSTMYVAIGTIDAVALQRHGQCAQHERTDRRRCKQVANNYTDMAWLLLDSGATTDVGDKNGRTPILWAAKSGNLEVELAWGKGT